MLPVLFRGLRLGGRSPLGSYTCPFGTPENGEPPVLKHMRVLGLGCLTYNLEEAPCAPESYRKPNVLSTTGAMFASRICGDR